MNKLSAEGGMLSRQQDLRIFSLWIQEAKVLIFRAALSGTLQLPLLTTKHHKSPDCRSLNSLVNGPICHQQLATKTKPGNE